MAVRSAQDDPNDPKGLTWWQNQIRRGRLHVHRNAELTTPFCRMEAVCNPIGPPLQMFIGMRSLWPCAKHVITAGRCRSHFLVLETKVSITICLYSESHNLRKLDDSRISCTLYFMRSSLNDSCFGTKLQIYPQ
jgi:hypothetical protein